MVETLSFEFQPFRLRINCNSKKNRQNRWIAPCMLKCHKAWCVFFMENVHTSILADIPGKLKERGRVEKHHRMARAGAKFNKHRPVLTDKYMKKFFNAVLTPSMLFSFQQFGINEGPLTEFTFPCWRTGKFQIVGGQPVSTCCRKKKTCRACK